MAIFAVVAVVASLMVDAREQGRIAAQATSYASPVVLEPTDPQPIALFIGDSQVAGFGSSRKTMRWSSQVSWQMGWREFNEGLGGTGYVKTSDEKGCGWEFCPNFGQHFENVSDDINADIVVVGGGRGDYNYFKQSPEKISKAMRDLYSNIAKIYPDAEIIAIGPNGWSKNDANAKAMNAVVQEAVESNGGTFVSIIDPPVIKDEWLLEDNAHVNNEGHTGIANHILKSIRDS
ncbi:SGNH/GDSL hydrolase family protein [Kocuria sp. CPCC 205231]|uniref:SGNH/GDSL hydrolase family protein n=1 Tax=Kocuria sp. CPCC 205231 TaxID=3073551 RepID=UPI0034D67BF7